MYELLKKEGRAKRGRFHTVHGTVETPVFMNVGTAAAIKGAVAQRIWRKSVHKLSCPTHIIYMSDPVMRL